MVAVLPQPELLAVQMDTGGRLDIYSGVARKSGKLWASMHRPADQTDAVVVIVHPSSNFLGHYLFPFLAGCGAAAVGMNTRYIANDSALIMENCVLDLGAVIRHLRADGFRRIVLMGNSGGGGLVAMYQRQAENPTITRTPAGDLPDLTRANLPEDGLIEFMAHPGRALVYTDWLDPAIVDEAQPFVRERSLDMFDADNGPPFSDEFLSRYRAAQRAPNDRITDWTFAEIARVEEDTDGKLGDLPLVVHGTCADPRFIDLSIDPSDREAGTLWGDPFTANYMPASLGHLTSLRSRLSQWSVRESNCDGPRHLREVSVPVLVEYGTADNSGFPSYAAALYEAVQHDRRELLTRKGVDHYFGGQPVMRLEAAAHIGRWLDTNVPVRGH